MSVSSEGRSTADILTSDKTTATKRCAESVGDFSAKLYAQIASKTEGNVFFSPLSVAACLQMVHQGARGSTRAQTAEVMSQAGIAEEDILGFYQDLLTSLSAQDEHATVSLANKVWIKDNYTVLEEYTKMLQCSLHADIARNPFTDPGAAADEVNNWVAKSTGGMIKQLIEPSMINPLTRLILCNAIYFKGLWEHPFDSAADEEFHVSARERKTVKMMRHNRAKELAYGENDVARWVVLPYRGNMDLRMMVLLPQVPFQLGQVEESICKAGVIEQWLKAAGPRDVNVKLPKFKFEQKYDLKEVLREMGVTDLFSEGVADLSGVDGELMCFCTVKISLL